MLLALQLLRSCCCQRSTVIVSVTVNSLLYCASILWLLYSYCRHYSTNSYCSSCCYDCFRYYSCFCCREYYFWSFFINTYTTYCIYNSCALAHSMAVSYPIVVIIASVTGSIAAAVAFDAILSLQINHCLHNCWTVICSGNIDVLQHCYSIMSLLLRKFPVKDTPNEMWLFEQTCRGVGFQKKPRHVFKMLGLLSFWDNSAAMSQWLAYRTAIRKHRNQP